MAERLPTDFRDDTALVDALRAGDEEAFASVLDAYTPTMLRVARGYVPSPAVAEEVVQETWLAVLEGLDRFEGRSSFRTWVFRILVKRAITRGTRERRSVPFSSLVSEEAAHAEPSVDPSRFLGPDSRWAGHWAAPPADWSFDPGNEALRAEIRQRIGDAFEALPAVQRSVVALRDVDGWTAQEVCDALGISEGNQRVLLHRGRTKLRHAIARYFGDE